MKNIILILLLLMSSISYGQIVKDANGNYHQQKRDTTSVAKATTHTFTDANGKVYPIYERRNGKLYIIRK